METKPIPDYGDKMTLAEFIDACKWGMFIDYDGFGYYATDTQMTDIIVYPSDITIRKEVKQEYSHVVWFNK